MNVSERDKLFNKHLSMSKKSRHLAMMDCTPAKGLKDLPSLSFD
jgi:hypothetical protein